MGLIGMALGIALGLGLCELFDAYPIFSHRDFVVRPMLNAGVVLLPAAVVFLTVLAAGFWPAAKAARSHDSAPAHRSRAGRRREIRAGPDRRRGIGA